MIKFSNEKSEALYYKLLERRSILLEGGKRKKLRFSVILGVSRILHLH